MRIFRCVIKKESYHDSLTDIDISEIDINDIDVDSGFNVITVIKNVGYAYHYPDRKNDDYYILFLDVTRDYEVSDFIYDELSFVKNVIIRNLRNEEIDKILS